LAGTPSRGPLFERGPERVVQRLLGRVEITEQPDERGQDTAGVGKVDGIHRLVDSVGRRHNN
jgi:hypothetical protein